MLAKAKERARASAAASAAAVDPAVCEHCSGKAAHGDSKYCEDCIVKLEKALGLVDEDGEEKNADGVGGSAEPSTAPGVSVEPPSTAPDGSVEQGAAAASQTARVCVECKEPATNGMFCAACDAKVFAELKSWKDAQRKVNQLKREAVDAVSKEYKQETERCEQCAPWRFCDDHNAKAEAAVAKRFSEIDAKFGQVSEPPAAPGVPVEHGAGGDGAGGATPAAPGVSVEPPPTAPGVPVEPAPTASAADEIFKFCGICTMPKPPDSCVSCPKCRDNVIKTEITPCEGCQLLAQQANPDATLCEKHAQLFDVVFLKARALTAADDGSAKGSAEVDKRTAIQ
jgi:hypothetical protein